MSPFVIFPWFLLFLIVTTTQPRRYGPLDGFGFPSVTGAQKTSVGVADKLSLTICHAALFLVFRFMEAWLTAKLVRKSR